MTGRATTAQTVDGATLGHRIRHFRKLRGMTLDELGQRIGKTAPFLSMLENGKGAPPRAAQRHRRRPRRRHGGADEPAAPTRRAELELALTGAQDDPLYAGLGLPRLRPSAKVPDVVLEHLVGLYRELRRRVFPTVATREEARIANAELRAEMRERGNYFAEIEQVAAGLVTSGRVPGRAPSPRATCARSPPPSASPCTGRRTCRDGALGHRPAPPGHPHPADADAMPTAGARSVILQTLGHFALEHRDPVDFADFLRQRIEANYFAAAVLLPEAAAVPLLDAGQGRSATWPSRTCATSSPSPTRWRRTASPTWPPSTSTCGPTSSAPTKRGSSGRRTRTTTSRSPRNSVGAIEGQRLCREWGTRQVFESDDKYSMHYQYTDTASGTYWCGTHVDAAREPVAAITVGVGFDDAQFFRGRQTNRHSVSNCPTATAAGVPSADLAERWEGWAWSSVRPNSHVLAAMPVETVPGVDVTEIYEFLDRHSGEQVSE